MTSSQSKSRSGRGRGGGRGAAAEGVRPEPRWPAAVAVLVALGLQLVLPERVTLGPKWLLPALEGVLLAALMLASPYRDTAEARYLRVASVAMIATVNLANVFSLARVLQLLLRGGKTTGAHQLIESGAAIWLTLVLIFGLWYWEFDRGGPARRSHPQPARPDLLFPQDITPSIAPPGWHPEFLDYLYVAFTNATAFSPTDTMPLTRWTKSLFGVQSLASLLTLAVVAARAVNILS